MSIMQVRLSQLTGEANQKKGYLLLDLETKALKRIRSEIPGWYDPTWPNFEETKPESWEGAHVRIKVPCDGNSNVGEGLRRATVAAQRTYRGAMLSVIPDFRSDSRDGTTGIKTTFTDEKKIRIYLKENLPGTLKASEQKVYDYLLEQLKQVGGLQREGGELKFKVARAVNFLSYRDLDIRFEEGLTVVSGRNKDWMDRSNGSGKSSYLQAIAVALFGQTFKGQKHDRWMRRGTDKGEKSFVKLAFIDSRGRDCGVYRGRQPNKLKLLVGKEVIEAGNRPGDTQRLIEQVTGYTWETLANAIYVDQGETHLMLTGTEAQRKGFLAKLQNLERFERAEKRIREDKAEYERKYEIVNSQIASSGDAIKELKETIKATKAVLLDAGYRENLFSEARYKYRTLKTAWDMWETEAAGRCETLTKRIAQERKTREEVIANEAKAQAQLEALEDRLENFGKLKGKCPTCFQPVSASHVKKHLAEWNDAIPHLEQQIGAYDGLIAASNIVEEGFEKDLEKWRRNKPLAQKVADARDRMLEAKEKLQQAKREQKLIDELKSRIADEVQKKEELEERRWKVSRKLEIMHYAQTVFQRNGLPAYLNAQICPELNQHAKEYAELFSQSEIQVRFAVDDEGRMDVQVMNAHGGEHVEDQSEGEMKIASLITAFAVRSLAPKTNILILDEPGDGLDAVSARSFAKGLREISKKFYSVLLTTHNPAILAELADSRLVEVVKHNGISSVK